MPQRPENKKMQEYLQKHGITCNVKFIWNGSLKNRWRLYQAETKWTPELATKFTELGFTGVSGPISQYEGNGGVLSVFLASPLTKEFLQGVTPPKDSTL